MIAGVTVLDFHGHVGRWERYGMVDDPARILAAMDAVGIDRSCVFNIFHPDGHTGNDRTAAFITRHPDRFIGFAYVSPLLAPETAVAELARAIERTENVRTVILLTGSATEKLRAALSTPVENPVRTMREAVARAWEASRPGDVILLSPGAASFELFRDEFDRGEQFRTHIALLGQHDSQTA